MYAGDSVTKISFGTTSVKTDVNLDHQTTAQTYFGTTMVKTDVNLDHQTTAQTSFGST